MADIDALDRALDRVADLMREHELAEIEVESEGFRVRLRKSGAGDAPRGAGAPAEPAAPAAGREPVATVVQAPVVGTFHRAGAPEAAPFVQVGDRVAAGDVLCVIEAMKLMNEIKAEFAGEVVEILADNGQGVEYGQPLFALLPTSGG